MHRLHPDEAKEVARLAAERHAATSSAGPTVEDLAEALGLPPSEIERLLAEVRGRRNGPPAFQAPVAHRRFGDRSAALSAALVLTLVLVVAALLNTGLLTLGRSAPVAEAPPPPETVTVPDVAESDTHDIVIERDGKRVRIHRESRRDAATVDGSGT